jgi:hypothetical protein
MYIAMKTLKTQMLVAAIMLSALFMQAQNPEKKSAGEYRISAARSLIQKKSTMELTRNNQPDQNSTRKLVTGSQMMPSAIIFQEYDEFSQLWINNMKMSFTYENGYEKENVTEVYIGDELIPSEKLIYYYNNVWELQETEIYGYVEDIKNWILTSKELSHTDDYGNITLEAYLSLNPDSQTWDTLWGTKSDYIYTSFGEPHEIEYQSYDMMLLEWLPLYKEVFVYDNNDRLEVFTYLYWDDFEEEYVPGDREEYTYDALNQWAEVLISSWYDDEWLLEYKLTDFEWFDFSQMKYLGFIAYIYTSEPDPWELFLRTTAEYHQELEELTYLLEEYYDYVSQQWVPEYREISEFDDNLISVLMTTEYFENGMWWIMMGIRNTYELNAQGFIAWNITEWYDSFVANDWVYWMKLIFEYENTTGVPVHIKPVASMQAYPNPFNDVLNLMIEQPDQNMVVNVFNSQGQLVLDQLFRSFEANTPVSLDLSRQQPGMYFVKVQAGGQTQMLKVVKK